MGEEENNIDDIKDFFKSRGLKEGKLEPSIYKEFKILEESIKEFTQILESNEEITWPQISQLFNQHLAEFTRKSFVIEMVADDIEEQSITDSFDKNMKTSASIMNQVYTNFEKVVNNKPALASLEILIQSLNKLNLSENEYAIPDISVFIKTTLAIISSTMHTLMESFITYSSMSEAYSGFEERESYKKIQSILENEKEYSLTLNEMLKNSSELISLPISNNEDLDATRKDLCEQLIKFHDVLMSLPLIEEYKTNLGDVNSHVATSKYYPMIPFEGSQMWPEKRDDRRDLIYLDMNNWLGITRFSEKRNEGNLQSARIFYRDFLDFIQENGYKVLKVTDYNHDERKQPVSETFQWGGETKRFRPRVNMFCYAEKCTFSKKEMRLSISSVVQYGNFDFICTVGAELFAEEEDNQGPTLTENWTRREFQENLRKSSEFKLKRDHDLMVKANKFLVTLMKSFDEWQRNNGLLKNHKFDSSLQELNLKGRTFDKLVLPKIKKQLLEDNIFSIISNSKKLKSMGVETNRGIMLAGPPGVGKSLTIDAIISKINCTVIYASHNAVVRGTEWLFDLARRYAPTVLILEDIDALGITSQRSLGSGGPMSALLNCMDGIESNDGVITIATSNHPEHLDWALVNRPGRFDIRLDYPYPDKKVLKEIFEIKLKPFDCENDVNIDKLIQKIPRGFTGSHIHDVVNQANYICVQSLNGSQSYKLTQKSLDDALERTIHNFNVFLNERKLSTQDLTGINDSSDSSFM